MNRTDIEARLVARAWRDPEFRDALKQNPRQLIDRELAEHFAGIKVPAKCQITVIEETADHMVLVFPIKPATMPTGVLSDEHLALVCGGTFPFHELSPVTPAKL